MTDTIQPAEQNSPTDCPVLSNNNEDDLHGLAPLFIKQHIQLLLSPSKAHKARRDQLRKPVGPPTTALDLKEITQKYFPLFPLFYGGIAQAHGSRIQGDFDDNTLGMPTWKNIWISS